MCYVDDAEMCEVTTQQMRKARKKHGCSECGRVINKDEQYEYCSMLYEGSWSHGTTCGHCIQARGWLAENCRGWIYGMVREDLSEHLDEGNPDPALPLLVGGMVRKWQAPQPPEGQLMLASMQPFATGLMPLPGEQKEWKPD